jgi:hypothetical protein
MTECKMRTVTARAFCTLCILHGASCISPVIARAEIIDRVLAVVGGVVITQSDATAAYELGLVNIGPTDDPLATALSKLIDRQLMLTEVERYAPPDPPGEAVDRLLQAVRAKFPASEAYIAALNRSGVDEPRLRQILRDQVRIDTYLDQRFTSESRATLISEWVSGLRRRTDITYLYLPRR